MERINVAELLKDCPKGMELDCSIFTTPVNYYNNSEDCDYPLSIITKNGEIFRLTKEGCLYNKVDAKCVIFPKGKTSWEGFVLPCQFKDGDIVCTAMDSIAILGNRIGEHSVGFHTYCGLFNYEFDFDVIVSPERLASEEEKATLFDVIKAKGYKWNAETKTLEELPKFKDGDVLFIEGAIRWILIYKENENEEGIYKYVAIPDQRNYIYIVYGNNPLCYKEDVSKIRFATEKEKEKLFQAIKDNGYRWNPETKALEKLIEPKFKVGDRIRMKENHNYIYTITGIREKENKYECGVTFVLRFSEQYNWELVPDKFDITTLVPFESRVLIRDYNYEEWKASFWGYLTNNFYGFNYDTIRGNYKQCIPYEGNQHLLGTTDDCDEYFKTWK